MIPFSSEDQRYIYDLTQDSVVLDCGGYEGEFAKKIAGLYRCRVLVFEPVSKFYFQCVKNLTRVPGVSIYMFGLGGSARYQEFKISNNSSGEWSTGTETETVLLRSLKDILDGFEIPAVDLAKLNIEGGEFEAIEAAIKDGTIKRIKNLQVQPHLCVPDSVNRWKRIQERLAETHELSWCDLFVWESWRRKE